MTIIEGAKAIADAAKDLPKYLDLCVSAESDLHALESWATVFIEPAYLYQTIKGNVSNHPYQVSLYIAKAKRSLAYEDYFQFGNNVGQFMAYVTTPLTRDEMRALQGF